MKNTWVYTSHCGVKYRHTFADRALTALDGDDYDDGAFEAVERTAANNSKAIGAIIEVLFNNGMLTEKDAKAALGIVGKWHIEQEEDTSG